MNTDENRCREKTSQNNSTQLYKPSVSSVLDNIITMTTLSLLLPVLFSCIPSQLTSEAETILKVRTQQNRIRPEIVTLDILAFNDDPLMRMDSYQRISYFSGDIASIRSQTGDKIIFACANSHKDIFWWSGISSFPSVGGMYAELQLESPDNLLMCGESRTHAGSPVTEEIVLSPIAAQVVLRSIRCDFSDTGYETEELTDVKAYLTNVNARCSLDAEDPVNPTHIINYAGHDEDDIRGFAHPEIIYRHIGASVGNRTVWPDIKFLCYPNAGREDGPGTPFTRLVIEGMIQGERFWWPVSINRQDGCDEVGIYRNRCYVYDIVIRRKGMKDPDTPVEASQAECLLNTMTWDGKGEHHIGF